MEPTRDALEAAVERDFLEPAPYLALGAHLRALGDPRGELIELMHAREPGADVSDRERAIIQELGPAGPWDARLGWRWGFAAEAELFVGDGEERALRRFLEHPSLRFVQVLDLHAGSEDEDAWTEYIVPVLAETRRACLRHVYVDQILYDGEDDPPRGAIDVAPLWSAAPSLAELIVNAGTIALGAPSSTALEELRLNGTVRDDELAALMAASPKLRVVRVNGRDVR